MWIACQSFLEISKSGRNFALTVVLLCDFFFSIKMKLLLYIVLLASVQYLRSEPNWLDSFSIERPKANDTIMLGEIIINYIMNYFSEDVMFVSMIAKLSKSNQSHVNEEFINDLFSVLDQAEFAHNILDQLENVTHDNRNAFNLVVVDDSSILS